MIETTYPVAVSAIFKAGVDAITAGAAALVGYTPDMRFQGFEKNGKPDGSKFWLRFSQQTVNERQATLSTCAGLPGQKRYTTTGIVFVQFFCPRSLQTGMELGRKLAILARDAYRGHALDDSIWFRNARINELAPESDSYRLNVVADYEYDELG